MCGLRQLWKKPLAIMDWWGLVDRCSIKIVWVWNAQLVRSGNNATAVDFPMMVEVVK